MPLDAYAWTDGSNGPSRGDRGAAAYVIADVATREIIEERVQGFLHLPDRRFTNNDMEMTAIHMCLEAALRIGVDDLTIHSDSEWCVKIIKGEYRLKAVQFQSMIDEIYEMARLLDFVSIRHVRREHNSRADWHVTTVTTVNGGSRKAAARPPALSWPQ